MVKIMENPIKMDDLGGKPTIFGNTQILPQFPEILAVGGRILWFFLGGGKVCNFPGLSLSMHYVKK